MKVLLDGDDVEFLPFFLPIKTKLERLFDRLSPNEVKAKQAFKRHRASKSAKARRNRVIRELEGCV